jgi:hypothetical protein
MSSRTERLCIFCFKSIIPSSPLHSFQLLFFTIASFARHTVTLHFSLHSSSTLNFDFIAVPQTTYSRLLGCSVPKPILQRDRYTFKLQTYPFALRRLYRNGSCDVCDANSQSTINQIQETMNIITNTK